MYIIQMVLATPYSLKAVFLEQLTLCERWAECTFQGWGGVRSLPLPRSGSQINLQSLLLSSPSILDLSQTVPILRVCQFSHQQ